MEKAATLAVVASPRGSQKEVKVVERVREKAVERASTIHYLVLDGLCSVERPTLMVDP